MHTNCTNHAATRAPVVDSERIVLVWNSLSTSVNFASLSRFKNSLLRVDLTQFSKCTRFFKFVLQGLYLETILWCTSYKYVHATRIVI